MIELFLYSIQNLGRRFSLSLCHVLLVVSVFLEGDRRAMMDERRWRGEMCHTLLALSSRLVVDASSSCAVQCCIVRHDALSVGCKNPNRFGLVSLLTRSPKQYNENILLQTDSTCVCVSVCVWRRLFQVEEKGEIPFHDDPRIFLDIINLNFFFV